jgi:hypothetical protein
MSDGSVRGGDYTQARKAFLEDEGVVFLTDGRVDMDVCEWRDRPNIKLAHYVDIYRFAKAAATRRLRQEDAQEDGGRRSK